jgi:hypothetical protein
LKAKIKLITKGSFCKESLFWTQRGNAAEKVEIGISK